MWDPALSACDELKWRRASGRADDELSLVGAQGRRAK
jgi:hypothetical protein